MATLTTGLDKLITVSAGDSGSFYARGGKRLFDLASALVGLAISSPLLILCALAVRLTSRGPVLFRQTRVGYRGRPFTLIKFRTLVEGAETQGSSVVLRGDPRLTAAGSWLRRTKLDELPQFINVLRGEMSLVGPRPRVPAEVDADDPRERLLQSVRPGVTSYATIHHRREADYCARHVNPQAVHQAKLLPQKRSLDCEYAQNLTLGLDLKLLLLTLMLVCVPGHSPARGLPVLGREVAPSTRLGPMLAELAGYMGAAWLAYTVRYDDAGFPDFYRRQMWLYIAFIPALRVGVNRCLGTYDLMWRYVTLEDAAHLAASLAPVTLALCALRLGLPPHSWQGVMFLVPLSIIALEYLLALGVGLGLRCLRRMIYVLHHHYQPLPEGARRVLILGAGMLGLVTAQDLRQYPHISLVGFLDDDPAKERRLMAGRRVLGNSAHLERAYARHKVTDVMICAKSMDAERRLEIHQRCSTLKIKVHMVPSLDWVLRDESDLPRFAHVPASLAGQRGQEHD